MQLLDLQKLLSENAYPGRGIVVGMSADGKNALFAYFIMGRSENSRNRVFEAFEGGVRTKAFDESRVSDSSLIIYNPYRRVLCGNVDVVTNGDQTDTVCAYLCDNGGDGCAFEKALSTREFEPDAPHYTPRISGILYYAFPRAAFTYKLSILKSAGGDPSACLRQFFHYAPLPGVGHFIHTYRCDGAVLPSFEGEPRAVALPQTAEQLADLLWNGLNEDNKISLLVRSVPLDGSAPTQIIRNKNR